MRTFILTTFVLTIVSSNVTWSQNQNWTKDDRNNVYNDYMDLLSRYKNLRNEQKESIALCCLDEITKKYNKDEYKSKIEIEIKRIQESTSSQCAKNIGVELNTENTQKEITVQEAKSSEFKKEDFEGVWNFESGTYTFYSVDGEFKHKHPSYANEARGKWYLDGKTLMLDDTKTVLRWGSAKYQIVSVSQNEIILINTAGGKICNLKKVQ